MIEAGGQERVEARFVKRQSRGDQIDVQACGAGGADEIDDVSSCERFAAREVCLQHTQLGGLLENSAPVSRS